MPCSWLLSTTAGMWTSGAHTLSARPHLNIKSLTEPGDQRTQPAVSQLPASRLRNAPLHRELQRRLSAASRADQHRGENAPCRSPATKTTAWKFLVPRLTPPEGPLCSAVEATKGQPQAPNLKESLRIRKEASKEEPTGSNRWKGGPAKRLANIF